MMISVFGGAAVEDSGFHLTDMAYQTMLFSNVAGFGGLAFYYRKADMVKCAGCWQLPV